MNLYERYLLEREGMRVITDPHGFLVYGIVKKDGELVGYISDYYVHPDHRRKGIGYKLARKAFNKFRKRGCKIAMCQTDNRTNGFEVSEKSILNFGFVEIKKDGAITHYAMEI